MPTLQFWFVSVGATLCLVLSLGAWTVGRRRSQAEVVLLGGAFSAMSILSLVHGLGAPGAVVDGTVVSEMSMALAFPVTAIGLVPLFVPGDIGSRLARRAGAWSTTTIAVAVTLGVGVWFIPETTAVPDGIGALMSGAVVVVVARVAARQIRLWRVGRNSASLVAAAGVVMFGLATAVGLRALPDSVGWWLVHVMNNVAVLLVGVALIVGYRQRSDLQLVMEPVLSRDPLVSLEVGLSPEVRAFLAALERKDQITRDHVVRTAELAMRTAERMGMGARQLRDVGLGGLMHDIGKLVVPHDILNKPGALTDEEFQIMRTHAERGAAILERSETLRDVAPLVRSHHERWDGGGYPDGLSGEEIPCGATVISVADSWDAMTHTRQYRRGMDRQAARRILDDGAGSQWSPAATAALGALIDAGALDGLGSVLGGVGQDPDDVGTVPDCLDALPPEVRSSFLGDTPPADRDDASSGGEGGAPAQPHCCAGASVDQAATATRSAATSSSVGSMPIIESTE